MSTDDHDPDDRHDLDDEPTETALADPDDYHRRQRLKEIHQRRRKVAEVMDGMDPWTKSDEHQRQKIKLGQAVSLYIAELEPIEERTDAEIDIPDGLPWNSATEFADKMGYYGGDADNPNRPSYEISLAIYRACNKFLAEVKPLLEEKENTEWEV